MMRSLWTAASGMSSQQLNVDTISNNLANVNTYGYKKERLEFKTLLYETMRRADLDENSETGKPLNLQVGHGVMPVATSRYFSTGNFERTDNTLDFAIEGNGFFVIQRSEDDIAYTKDGSFKVSIVEDGLMIVTSEGHPVLGIDDEPLIVDADIQIESINVAEDGTFSYVDSDGVAHDLGIRFQLIQFSNIQGPESVGSNLFKSTPASGLALSEADEEVSKTSRIIQGVIESSNVQVAEEMIKLIVAQRAYELNSKAIQTSDDMLQLANNLKR